jgi:hypothetical protein
MTDTKPPPDSEQQGIANSLITILKRRTTWDELPGLYQIHHQGDRGWLSEIPVPAGQWRSASVNDVLSVIEAGLAEAVRIARPEAGGTMAAVAFRHEERVLRTGPGTEARGQAAAPGRDGDRIEARVMYAADRHGNFYAAKQERGAGSVEVQIVGASGAVRTPNPVPGTVRRIGAIMFPAPGRDVR